MPIKKYLESKTPVHVWTDDIDPLAESQLKKLAALPFVYRHIAVMADVHVGIGSTVGTVLATKGAIIPACVGVDIGCGMMAVKTSLSVDVCENQLPHLRSEIEKAIPVGFDQNDVFPTSVTALDFWKGWKNLHVKIRGDEKLEKKARLQCGSLGGGNHFIEICRDPDNSLWILLHSGSRHIGKTLADVHIQTAKGEMKELATALPDPNLAYLQQGSESFQAYIHDLLWAQQYAAANREEMMNRLIHILRENYGYDFKILTRVNCHHNYSAQEEHFGERVWITRKGAVSARKGEMGIIPGSMGRASYIIRGKGNPESFMSCSHGAGRRMSRKQAIKTFHREDLIRETQGVECRKDKGVLDEIPSAYKDIDQVMRNQSDLVEIEAKLKQILCVKG